MSNTGVYVLKLNDNIRYVGMSDDIKTRIKKHKEGTGATITKEKGVKCRVKTRTKKDTNYSLWEKNETLYQMMKHGFNNVRGYQWVSSKPLSYNDVYSIKQLIFGEYNVCYKCGQNDHYSTKCTNSVKEKWLDELNTILDNTKQINIKCYKCNRYGHYANKCPYHNSNRYNTYYDSNYIDIDIDYSDDDIYYNTTIKCYNCGKFGHYSNTCYSNQYYYDSSD